MNSVPPIFPAGQQRKRNTMIVILVAAVLAIFMGTVFLWPALSSTGNVPTIFSSKDAQIGENPGAAPLTHEVLSPAVNPELRIQDRFRAERTGAARSMLYDNPELKTLEYAGPAKN